MSGDKKVNCGEHVNILALDIATTTGFAVGRYKRMKHGHFTIPALPSHGQKFLSFSLWLTDMIENNRPEYIAIESPFVRGSGTFYLFGLVAMAECVAASYGIPVSKFANSTIKKHLTGSGKASKMEMIEEVIKLGFDVEKDDEADAIALHLYTQSQIHYHLDEEED